MTTPSGYTAAFGTVRDELAQTTTDAAAAAQQHEANAEAAASTAQVEASAALAASGVAQSHANDAATALAGAAAHASDAQTAATQSVAAAAQATATTAGLTNGAALKTITLSSVVALMAATIDASVGYVRVHSYYADTLELHAGALWQRSPTQAAASGRRRSADGTYWQIAESTIDPCMLSGRSSDTSFDSTAAIAEALSFCNANYSGAGITGGARTVRLNPPAKILPYPSQSGAYCVSTEIANQAGVRFEIAPGACLKAIPTAASVDLGTPAFNGAAIMGTPDNAVWQAQDASFMIHGNVDCGGLTGGMWIRAGAYITANCLGGVFTGCKLIGYKCGSATSTYPAFGCHLFGGRFSHALATTYAGAATANDAASIGLWQSVSSDCTITGQEDIIGFRTGVQDDGTNNRLVDIHPWTGKISSTAFGGPMTVGFQINSTGGVYADFYIDTPTTMGNTGIAAVYCVAYSAGATCSHLNGLKTLLNYDDPANTGSGVTGICRVLNVLLTDTLGSNTIENVSVQTAAAALTYYSLITGSGLRYLGRTNVRVRSGVTLLVGSGDVQLAYERPTTIRRIDANQRRNWLDNAAFSIWQRGAGPFDCSAASNRVVGPDRWSSISDGAATRALAQVPITFAETGSYYQQARYALNISQSGAPTGTYWRIEQQFPVDYLYALQQRDMSFQMVIKLLSGAWPGTNIALGFRQNFGTSGSAEIVAEVPFSVGTLNANYKAISGVLAQCPTPSGKTIGAGAYLGIYLTMPITGTWSVSLSEMMLTMGSERPIFEFPSPEAELRKAQRYYEQVQTVNLNGAQFYPFQPKASVPTVTSANGVVGTVTQNGVLITDTQQRANTLTVVSAEP